MRGLTLVAATIVGFFSWLGLASGMPRIWSPVPLATTIPLMISSGFIGNGAVAYWIFRHVVPAATGAFLFLAWNPQLLSGRGDVPRRSRVGLGVLTVLNFALFVVSWDDGLAYQGRTHTVGVLALNCATLATAWGALVWTTARPSYSHSLFFHSVAAVWLVWVAFPWLGELP